MASTPTHEPCGNGHQKPVGEPCGLCSRADVRRDRQLDRTDKALEKVKKEQEEQKKRNK